MKSFSVSPPTACVDKVILTFFKLPAFDSREGFIPLFIRHRASAYFACLAFLLEKFGLVHNVPLL